MAQGIELEIRNWLKQRIPSREIVQKLLKRARDPNWSAPDRHSALAFILNSGHGVEIFNHFCDWHDLKVALPWGLLLEAAARAELKPDRETLEAVIKGAKKTSQVEDLVVSRAWDKWDPRFAELRREVENQRQERHRRQRDLLMEKLGFYRNQRLVEEEERLLELLTKMYPEDAQLKSLKIEFRERWARHVLSRYSESSADRWPDQTATQITGAVSPWEMLLMEELRKLANKYPDHVEDLAMVLVFMENYAGAIEVLKVGPLDPGGEWLMVELLLCAQRYVEVLDWCDQLDRKYQGDPETAFGTIYLRARALWGLGQTADAVEALQSILAVRPQFRSAAALLSSWQGVGA